MMHHTLGSRILLASILLTVLAACGREDTAVVAPESPAAVALEPAAGPIGTEVVITGHGFGGDPAAVGARFAGAPGKIRSVTPDRIVAMVPEGAASGALEVTLNGARIGVFSFEVTTALPGVSSKRKWTMTTIDVTVEGIRGMSVTTADNRPFDSAEVDLAMHCSGSTSVKIGGDDTLWLSGMRAVVDTVNHVFKDIGYLYSTSRVIPGRMASEYTYTGEASRLELNDIPYTVDADGVLTATLTGNGIGSVVTILDKIKESQSGYAFPLVRSHVTRLLPFTSASRIAIVMRPGK